MFLKLIRYSYSSSGKSFACQPFSVRSLFGLIQDFSIRMENAVIENQDFEVLISHYDRPDAFFYCDPPYFSSEYVYECGFTWEDHVRLQSTLADAKGKWLVSYNDCPESGICTGDRNSLILSVSTPWCRNMRRARNSLNCSSATMTCMRGSAGNRIR